MIIKQATFANNSIRWTRLDDNPKFVAHNFYVEQLNDVGDWKFVQGFNSFTDNAAHSNSIRFVDELKNRVLGLKHNRRVLGINIKTWKAPQ